LHPAARREKLDGVSPTEARPIVFLSDFGYRNEWVGICDAVIAQRAPASRVVHLSHGVPPLDVQAGALLLLDSLPYVAEDAVVLAVVDPSVGRDRDIAVETTNGRLFVGPDNGLMALAWNAAGGLARAHEITAEELFAGPVSPSFHARDVLAPAAAHLASGGALESVGPAIEASSLAELRLPAPTVEDGKVVCEVLDLNRFGNVLVNARESDFAAAGLDGADCIAIDATSGSARARRVMTYADLSAGEWGIIVDPRGWLSIIRGNPENAAAGLGGVQPGDPIWLNAAR
jgi:S-adenosylmethionine hydrolase